MTWVRAIGPRPCGRCSALIAAGEPVLFVTAAQLWRCVACAKVTYQAEPPVDLAPLPVPEVPREQPFVAVRRLVGAFDARMAQTGERE